MTQRRPASLFIAAAAAAAMVLAACGSAPSDTGASSGDSNSSAPGTPEQTSAETPAETSAETSAGDSVAESSSEAPTADDSCAPANLATKKPGTLTIATDEPVFEPWFVDDDPSSGKGFEGAMAYAIANQLGYGNDQVTWVRAGFDAVISPAPKDFDFDINEFSITPDRAKVVDFSSGYYDVTQAVVTVAGSKIADAKSLADLKGALLGAQIGTTSLQAINDTIAPTQKAAVFTQNIDAVMALKNGQIDGVVTDLPTAFYMAGAQLDNGLVIGQLPDVAGAQVEQFGLLLEKDSPITSCVSAAVDALRAAGTLTEIADTWLAQAGAPELK